jgi:hypothetical protein
VPAELQETREHPGARQYRLERLPGAEVGQAGHDGVRRGQPETDLAGGGPARPGLDGDELHQA